MQTLTKQHGAAIIVALFVVALVAMLATLMIERLNTDVRRTQLVLNANSAYLYAQGSIAWAIDQLNNDAKQQQPDTVMDKTPIQSAVDKQGGFTISSTIYDAQGFFNLNNLTDSQYQANFTRLIQLVAPEIEASVAQNITAAIIDWLSPGSKNPTLDEYYLKLNPAYRAAHHPMVSISELSLVKGVTPALFAKLSPFLTALPEPTPININNASPTVLMSLSTTLTADGAKTIVAEVRKKPFSNTQNFLSFDVVKNNPIDAAKITVKSNYFLVQTNVTLGDETLVLYTLLGRITQDSKTNTVILWQSKGTQ